MSPYVPDYRCIDGIRIHRVSYEEVIAQILLLAAEQKSSFICVGNAHVISLAARYPRYKEFLNEADITTPDGISLSIALRLLGLSQAKRVCGPVLFPRLCAEAALKRIRIGFYGGKESTLARLRTKIQKLVPRIDIVYAYSPPFRELSDDEDRQIVRDIIDAGVQLLFIGLGCPKQEIWAALHKGRIPAVMVTVGAAFDFVAGSLKRAPEWMQRTGLEWLYRLIQEPQRLWKRYLIGNSVFLYLLLKELFCTYVLKMGGTHAGKRVHDRP